MLFNHDMVLNRELEAHDKIRKCMLMKDIMAKKCIATKFKIQPVVASPKTIESFPISVKSPKVLARVLEIVGGKATEFLNNGHLVPFFEAIEHPHALVTEIELIHANGLNPAYDWDF